MNRVIYIQEFPVVEENNSYWHDSGLLRVKKAPSVLDKLKASPLSRSVLEAATESLPKISTGKAESKKKATVRNASSADSGILPAAIHKVPHSVKFEAECAPSSSETLIEPAALLKTVGAVQKVATRLFNDTAHSDVSETVPTSKLSSVDQLSYAERLQVMIMQIQEAGVPDDV